ncbi:hypothetical protein [Marivita sp. GX14005]|uniref:hypothetical protein n=1 Tax=Marivita sp. GX14005 TaxID=2942276 RepID=UPI0020199AD4|nr:hypothetical protein [Marivita sp. GX14005]MCL3883672.1 hypothetical protein [Marivita sp. GX14005]
MPEISAFGFMGSEASQALFGANVLATRLDLEQGGDYDRVIEQLGIGTFRYPGGSLTERYFDIANPNAGTVVDRDTGETRDFIPLNEALSYAGQEGLSVTIVIPTRNLLSDMADENGDRFAAIDDDVLRGFVRDVVGGVHGEAEIEAFEIGNEYWGSGQMSSIEYGRLASQMARVVDDELTALNHDADIIVQSGTNFDFARLSDGVDEDMSGAEILADLNDTYGLDLGEDSLFGSGAVNWTHVANEMILSEFDTAEERASVDQIAVHVYSRGQVNESQRSFMLNTADETWGEDIPEARIAATEWNTAGNSGSLDRTEDYGLFQAQEMLNVMEEFLRYDVEQAHVWPLIQNTPNTLSVDDGQADLSPGGAMFAMMQDALPGKTALDLTPERGADTEAEEDGVAVHGFWEPDELLFYIAATGEAGARTSVDLSALASDPGEIEVTHLGVADGAEAGSSRSDAVVSALDPEEVMEGTTLGVDLRAGEILELRMFGFTPSREFQSLISQEAPEDLPDPMIEADAAEAIAPEMPLPTIPFDAAEQERLAAQQSDEMAEEETEDEGDLAGLGDLMAAIPFLGLLAYFM